jgi:hypothetical protein
MSRNVSVDAGQLTYVQNISVGTHALRADEPVDVGGSDAGSNPYELLLAALGSRVRASLFECIPSGNSGLYRAYMLTCHGQETMLKIALSAIPS